MTNVRGRRLLALAASLVALMTVAGTAAAQTQEPGSFTLTLLHANDGESELLELIRAGGVYGGAARTKTLVDVLRLEARLGYDPFACLPFSARYALLAQLETNPSSVLGRATCFPQGGPPAGKRGVVLLSSGDNIIPGPQFNASLEKGVPFYDSIAMSLIGFDASAIGNHEFDLGPDVFADFVRGFEPPVPFVSANLGFAAEPNLQALVNAGRLARSTVLTTAGERIGVVGVTTPLLPAISSPRRVTVDPNIVAAIQGEIDRLEAAGVNKIILVGQLQGIREDLALAPRLRGIDIIVSGGGEELLANPGTPIVPEDTIFGAYPLFAVNANGANVPVVTAGSDYKYVGRLVAAFDASGNLLSIDTAKSRPFRVSGTGDDAVPPSPSVQARVVQPVAAAVAGLAARVVGTSEVPLDGRRDPGVRTRETNLGDLMADALLWQANRSAAAFGAPQAQIALQNAGGIRNSSLIPPGPITELTTFAIAPFANFVSIVPNIPAAQLKEVLENAVSKIPVADGRFAQIAGFRFTYDVAGTAQVTDNAGTVLTPGTRVREVVLANGTVLVSGGAVVAGAPAVNIATIDFLARGGDQYPFRGAPFITVGATYQQALRNYIQTGLGGVIRAAEYPEAGRGRITRVN